MKQISEGGCTGFLCLPNIPSERENKLCLLIESTPGRVMQIKKHIFAEMVGHRFSSSGVNTQPVILFECKREIYGIVSFTKPSYI